MNNPPAYQGGAPWGQPLPSQGAGPPPGPTPQGGYPPQQLYYGQQPPPQSHQQPHQQPPQQYQTQYSHQPAYQQQQQTPQQNQYQPQLQHQQYQPQNQLPPQQPPQQPHYAQQQQQQYGGQPSIQPGAPQGPYQQVPANSPYAPALPPRPLSFSPPPTTPTSAGGKLSGLSRIGASVAGKIQGYIGKGQLPPGATGTVAAIPQQYASPYASVGGTNPYAQNQQPSQTPAVSQWQQQPGQHPQSTPQNATNPMSPYQGTPGGAPQYAAPQGAQQINQYGNPNPGTPVGVPPTSAPQPVGVQYGGPQPNPHQYGIAPAGTPQPGATQQGFQQFGSGQHGGNQYRHSQPGTPQAGAPQPGAPHFGGPQYGGTPPGPNPHGFAQHGTSQPGALPTGAPQQAAQSISPGVHQYGNAQTGIPPVGAPQPGPSQPGTAQYGGPPPAPHQYGIAQSGTPQPSPPQQAAPQYGFTQPSNLQTGTPQSGTPPSGPPPPVTTPPISTPPPAQWAQPPNATAPPTNPPNNQWGSQTSTHPPQPTQQSSTWPAAPHGQTHVTQPPASSGIQAPHTAPVESGPPFGGQQNHPQLPHTESFPVNYTPQPQAQSPSPAVQHHQAHPGAPGPPTSPPPISHHVITPTPPPQQNYGQIAPSQQSLPHFTPTPPQPAPNAPTGPSVQQVQQPAQSAPHYPVPETQFQALSISSPTPPQQNPPFSPQLPLQSPPQPEQWNSQAPVSVAHSSSSLPPAQPPPPPVVTPQTQLHVETTSPPSELYSPPPQHQQVSQPSLPASNSPPIPAKIEIAPASQHQPIPTPVINQFQHHATAEPEYNPVAPQTSTYSVPTTAATSPPTHHPPLSQLPQQSVTSVPEGGNQDGSLKYQPYRPSQQESAVSSDYQRTTSHSGPASQQLPTSGPPQVASTSTPPIPTPSSPQSPREYQPYRPFQDTTNRSVVPSLPPASSADQGETATDHGSHERVTTPEAALDDLLSEIETVSGSTHPPAESILRIEPTTPVTAATGVSTIQEKNNSTSKVQCPGNLPLPEERDWYSHPSAPAFLICPPCFEVDIKYVSSIASSFSPVRKTNGKCYFNCYRISKILWPEFKRNGNLSKILAWMKRRTEEIKDCTGVGAVNDTKWFTIAQDEFPGFAACEACYEDLVLATSISSRFEKAPFQHGTTCDVVVTYIQRMIVKRLDQQYVDWNGFLQGAKMRLSLLPCPQVNARPETEGRWWTMKGLSIQTFSICEECHADHVDGIEIFSNLFEPLPATSSSSQVGWSVNWMATASIISINCDFTPNFPLRYAINLSNMDNQVLDFEKTRSIVKFIASKPRCGRPEGLDNGLFYNFHNELPGFGVCEACYIGVLKPHGFDKFFKDRPQMDPGTVYCCFHPGYRRSGQYINKFFSAVRGACKFGDWEQEVRSWNSIPGCPRDEGAAGRHWWGWKDCTACQECFETVIVGSRYEKLLPSYEHFLEGENMCCLFSPRMRGLYQEACETGDLDRFKFLCAERMEIWKHTVPRILTMAYQSNQDFHQSLVYSSLARAAKISAITVFDTDARYTSAKTGATYQSYSGIEAERYSEIADDLWKKTSAGVRSEQMVELQALWDMYK
ncbi:hypothetical protein QBC38DRAFT_208029 [Podospora fimiseda]|uniref:Integral membrane protein n=1 Tax=Podospora fimiseda TaxID=252190 RepID=A0AAN7BPF4_9PEZI|nr:hypothetical protein QBC38DRAFT_208029 [Podospora fimiseda]